MQIEKWIGVHTGGPHYLDHLGVLCEGLEIPLLVSEEEAFQVAKEFYPGLQVEHVDLIDLNLDLLASRADVIFESGHYFASELIPLWELTYGKKMRVVYCPHGNSDKGYKGLQRIRKDISLVYGEHMQNHLEKAGEMSLLEKTVMTGNYRYPHYLRSQSWYDSRLEKFLAGKFKADRKTVFYAPSWSDGENDSSWLSHCMRVVEEVGSRFNLLIRCHPFLETLYPAEGEKFRAACEQAPGIIDLSTFPSIYPILNRADSYLGDFSSIGYDFLFLDKPLFFLDSHHGEIYGCGVVLSEEEHWGKSIETFKDNQEWSAKRTKLSKKVFGEKKSFKKIKKDLIEALSYDRASWIRT